MSSHESTVGSAQAWWAFVPVLVGAAVALLLRRLDLPEFSEVAGAMIATLVAGAPFYRRAVEQDEDRAIRESPRRIDGRTAPAITAGRATIALSIVLGAAAFWLTDITTSMFGFGSLGFLGEPVPYDPTEQYLSASLRGTPLQVVAVFAIAVWLSHRLRAAAGPALTQATGLYVAAVVVTNVAFASMAERMLSSAEIIVPLLSGVLVWLVTVAGRGYARRTQARFDAMRMALAR
jgi:hypothetical protein